jgi:hypothetical protein
VIASKIRIRNHRFGLEIVDLAIVYIVCNNGRGEEAIRTVENVLVVA